AIHSTIFIVSQSLAFSRPGRACASTSLVIIASPPSGDFKLPHAAPDSLAFTLTASLIHQHFHLLHHGFFSVVTAVATTPSTPLAGIPAHRISLASTVARATTISAAHVCLPVSGLGIPIVLQHFNLVQVLDGVGQLVYDLQVASAHFRLAGNLVQLLAELVFQFVHVFHDLSPFKPHG